METVRCIFCNSTKTTKKGSRKTKHGIKQINCAWFDENNYYIFPSMKGYISLKDYLRKNH